MDNASLDMFYRTMTPIAKINQMADVNNAIKGSLLTKKEYARKSQNSVKLRIYTTAIAPTAIQATP